MTKAEIGRKGEDFCCLYYKKLGYEITARNYHSRYGEIDVIAENETYLVFSEVKTRGEKSISEAREAVTASKQRKIIMTALDYLSKNGVEKQLRFDVFEVLHRNGKIYKFRNNENAFEFDERILGNIDY